MEDLPDNTNKLIVFINLFLVLIFFNFHLRKFSFINKINKSKFLNNDKIDYFILLFFILLIYNYLNNYFSLYFITDIHENAWINTALAFSENINPLEEKNISEHANLYSTFWPLIISKLSFFIDPKVSSIKFLMTVINLFSFITF